MSTNQPVEPLDRNREAAECAEVMVTSEPWLTLRVSRETDLISADVVTADGTFRQASATDNPELFWALRGGGGNFGVVTSPEYRLHPVAQVLGGLVLHPLEQAPAVLRFYRDYCPTLPDEAEAFAALLTAPQGMPVVALLLGYNGSLEDGERVLAPARGFGNPIADLVGAVPYAARQTMLDAPNAEHGLHRYWRSAFTEQISDGLIDAAVDGAAGFTSSLSALVFFHMHGAATRPLPTETAFAAPPGATGFRCDRSMGGRYNVRPACHLGASALEPTRAALARKGLPSTTWPPTIAPRWSGHPSAKTTHVFDRSRRCTTQPICST